MQEPKTEDADEQSGVDLTDEEFIDIVRTEGITLDGKFYKTHGTGRQTRYFVYDPGVVKGLDAIREDGDIVAQNVANHDEAEIDQVAKGDVLGIKEKVEDGFGIRGLAVVEQPPEDQQSDDEPEFEPMGANEVIETIRENFEGHGFFDDADGEQKVVSLAHPEARLMGYITGSHVKALPNSLETVDNYRSAVYEALVGGDEDVLGDAAVLESPDDVPIATGDMMEKFTEYGQQLDDEQKDKLSEMTKARWEDGEYDHLRGEDDEPEPKEE